MVSRGKDQEGLVREGAFSVAIETLTLGKKKAEGEPEICLSMGLLVESCY